MVDGKLTEYETIKGTDVFEFWKIFDAWKQRTERERQALRERRHKK